MSTMPSQITSLTIVYSTVYSAADQRKHQRSASLALVRGIHRWPVNSLHKGPVTRKMFQFDDVIMHIWLMDVMNHSFSSITHAPLFRGGADDVYESLLGDSRLVMNIHNPFMHCATSQCVFKMRDVIMLMRAVTIVAAWQQHRPPRRYPVASL